MNINDDLKVNGMQKVKMPKIKHISFTNYLEQMQAPFVIYVDFECLTVPISEKRGNNSEAYQEHKACDIGTKWFPHIVNEQKYTEGLVPNVN